MSWFSLHILAVIKFCPTYRVFGFSSYISQAFKSYANIAFSVFPCNSIDSLLCVLNYTSF